MSSTIPEQLFTCSTCNYVAMVSGKRYFELGCNFHIETRKCRSCIRLFDNIVTKTVTEEEIKAKSNEFYNVYANHKWNNTFDEIMAHGVYLEQIKGIDKDKVNCRWCGSMNNEVWHKEKPICPKCGNSMDVSEGIYVEDRVFEYYNSFYDLINSSPKIIACLTDKSNGISRHVGLMIEEILQENPDEFCFLEFDTSYAYENNLINKYQIKYLPTLLHFKNGQYMGKFSNVDFKQDLLNKIRKRFDKM